MSCRGLQAAAESAALTVEPLATQSPISVAISDAMEAQSFDPLAAADAEPELCCICTDPLGEGDDHGALQLGCGHVFGARCIQEWLRVDKKTRRCPTCNTAAEGRQALRPLCPLQTALRVQDGGEEAELVRAVEQARAKRQRAEHDAARLERERDGLRRRREAQQREARAAAPAPAAAAGGGLTEEQRLRVEASKAAALARRQQAQARLSSAEPAAAAAPAPGLESVT